MLDEINRILRERGVLDEDASISGITLGEKESTPEELADMIERALTDIGEGGGRDIDINY